LIFTGITISLSPSSSTDITVLFSQNKIFAK
jgi:hypothetical protein